MKDQNTVGISKYRRGRHLRGSWKFAACPLKFVRKREPCVSDKQYNSYVDTVYIGSYEVGFSLCFSFVFCFVWGWNLIVWGWRSVLPPLGGQKTVNTYEYDNEKQYFQTFSIIINTATVLSPSTLHRASDFGFQYLVPALCTLQRPQDFGFQYLVPALCTLQRPQILGSST